MLDREGRSIEYLRLSITDRCNCRCVYCMPEGGVPMLAHDQILSFEELARIVRACAELGVRKVRLTGGEPLAPRGVVDLVRMVAEVPGVEDVAMTTNACQLAPIAADLRAAGLGRLNVSLDTLRPERYAKITRCGRLADALAGIAAAREAGFARTKMRRLMGGVSDDEVADLAALTGTSPSTRSSSSLIGPAAGWPRRRFLPADYVLGRLPAGAEPRGRDGVAELWHVPGWAGNVGLIRPMSHKFCDGCSRIRVTADGRCKPCLHSSAEVDLRGLEGEALLAALRGAIAAKPKYHHMDESHASESARDMNEIGG